MPTKRRFLDHCVVEAAFRTKRLLHDQAKAILADPDSIFLATSLLELEMSPPFYGAENQEEAAFYRDYIDNIVSEFTEVNEALISRGIETSKLIGADALDAMHLTAAIHMEADEFITAERKDRSPFFRELRIKVTHVTDA